MIKIMKASAGSGKTWNLARQYIRLLLEAGDSHAYRHILAVTFTNKATDEMKERILEKLHELSKDPKSSDYYDYLVPSVCPDEASLKEASGRLLCNILHDYGAFAVSTIDRFFQQTLKAFARETGHFSSYSIELDKGSLIKESVDRLLDSLTDAEEHARSLEWMTRKTMSQLEEGEGYRLDRTLRKIAERFNSEEYRVALEASGADESKLYSDERLSLLQERCEEVMTGFVDALSGAVTEVSEAFAEAGVNMDDTSSGFMSRNLRKFTGADASVAVKPPTEAFRRKALDPSAWFAKKNRHLEPLVTGRMTAAVDSFFEVFDSGFKVYNTAHALKGQIYGFAVANDLYRHYREMLKEKNVLTIDQTNDLLRKIIDGADAPFIYEKTGVRYEHFLLDEFQDTSLVQWDNFRPLLQNSVSQGYDNLIVGDVKQSIYRWRQSDWGLLEKQVQKEFPDMSEVETLDTNFRSCKGIVEFNNAYFKAASEYLDRRYGDDTVGSIYADVCQKAAKEGEGMVEFVFCDDDLYYHRILEAVQGAVAVGYRLGDIAVLVRLNQEGADIAEYLIANGVSVLSDDSLKVASSLTVRRLAALLSGMDNPEDEMALFLSGDLRVEMPESYHSLVDLCESLLRGLEKADPDTYAAETLYIQSFMDIVQDFVSAHGNSLRAFLKKWSEDKSNISSPKSEDSVRIMTVHKSKGLDFPYVIFPSLESVGFFAHGNRWSKPEVEGTELEDAASGVYDVHLSGKSVDTLFEGSYRNEVLMQYVDNINILYVAFTRASRAMSVISAFPGEVTGDFSGFSQWTYAFIESEGENLGFVSEGSAEEGAVVFRKGEFPAPPECRSGQVQRIPSHFVSFPLNQEPGDENDDVRERGRLKFSTDSLDFFSEEGQTGVAASNRIRGVVLHDILSRVRTVGDLGDAVAKSVVNGELREDEAEEAMALLSGRIAQVADHSWFPDDPETVFNESELIDTDGSILRPDRVVVSDGRVTVVDYKFGEHRKSYERQVRRYADIWSRMGYDEVSAYLWYVQSGEVKKIV